MMKQKLLSGNSLKAAFAIEKKRNLVEWQEYDLPAALESISQAVKNLQDMNINVHLELTGDASEDAFSLIRTVGEVKGITSPISGLLKIDEVEYLLAFSVREEEKPVLKMYLSQFNYKGQGKKDSIRGKCFDLKEDAEAMIKFQQRVIFTATRNDIIREYDVCNIFENNGITRLNKGGLVRPRL